MAYQCPQPYKCDRCGHEMQYTPHERHPAPVVSDDPVCPKCFERFIREHCGILQYSGPPLR